jgi:hypothetical protein
MLKSVVLPEPEGPRMEMYSPYLIFKVNPTEGFDNLAAQLIVLVKIFSHNHVLGFTRHSASRLLAGLDLLKLSASRWRKLKAKRIAPRWLIEESAVARMPARAEALSERTSMPRRAQGSFESYMTYVLTHSTSTPAVCCLSG